MWCAIILVLCVIYLFRNTYALLDKAIKVLMVILAISTVIAMILAFTNIGYTPKPEAIAPELWTVSGVAFLIALMGWMPIPIDASAWQSIWTLERIKETKYTPQLGEIQLDFNLGYIGTAIIALCFLTLGAMVMYGSGQEYAASAAGFSNQLIELYTSALGDWAFILIAACAFTTMFSTTLTVTDTYPRVVNEFVSVLNKGNNQSEKNRYKYLLIGVSTGSLLLLIFLGDQFRFSIDLATTMSFLMAPVLAFMNHKLIHQPEVEEQFRPRAWLYWLSISGIIFLTLFALIYLYWMLLY
jgi:Mn2+/Fe2+ NRAMP family transporter